MAKAGQAGLDSITGAVSRVAAKGPPPVERWNPPFCGDLDMRIAADGTWFYLKTPIGRPALVKLFASVLKREGDKYFLVTPVEKCGIQVEDAPFLAVEMKAEDGVNGRVLHFRTNVDDWVACGPEHPLRFEPEIRHRWSETLPSRASRFMGKGDPCAFLRSRRAWRRTQCCGPTDVRRGIDGQLFCNGGRRTSERLRVNDLSTAAQQQEGHDFFARARTRLVLDVPPALADPNAPGVRRGDLDLDPALWERAGVRATKPASVLVPVVDRATPTVLLTHRTPDLSSHAAQVAFPGGKIDPGDESPVAAALREAKEEVGLSPMLVEPIGYLDLYLTFSGFRILPTVARVKPDFALTLNPSEVTEAFEVPLDFLMNPTNHERKTRDWKGIAREYYAMPFGEHYIWGITAGILRNLYERIYGS